MTNDEQPEIPEGWVGGFAESNPLFAYPKDRSDPRTATRPDLSSLDMLDNMANIHLLRRQQAVLWPEFSWESEPGNSDPKRCYQMFAPDISRLGYTDEGRVYSIICPQQGVESPSFGSINLEVTVTGQRGWVDEKTRELACDMSVEAKVWFAPGAREKPAVKLLWKLLDELGHDFPICKDKAIVIGAHKPGDVHQPIFRLSRDESPLFDAPEFARHHDEAWSVGHLEAGIGGIKRTRITAVDDFNRLFLHIFNLSSGNMLKEGTVLTWNVWFNHPEIVHEKEWHDHAWTWRRSIDVDQTSPDRYRSPARFHDGSPFNPVDELLEEEIASIYDFVRKQFSAKQSISRSWKSLTGSIPWPKSLRR